MVHRLHVNFLFTYPRCCSILSRFDFLTVSSPCCCAFSNTKLSADVFSSLTVHDGSSGSGMQVAILTRVLQLVHGVLSRDIHVTKRDLFYTDVKLFKDQKDSDGVLDDISCMLGKEFGWFLKAARAALSVVEHFIFQNPQYQRVAGPRRVDLAEHACADLQIGRTSFCFVFCLNSWQPQLPLSMLKRRVFVPGLRTLHARCNACAIPMCVFSLTLYKTNVYI